MQTIILANRQLETKYEVFETSQLKYNKQADVIIVNSDDYFDENTFKNLMRLKRKYMAIFVIGFTEDDLLLYNKQYVDFCYDNNINFIGYDKTKETLDEAIDKTLVISSNYTKFAKYYDMLQTEIDYDAWLGSLQIDGKTVVDYGCGETPYASYFTNCDYTGIDLSNEMVKRGQAKYPNLKFEVGDVTTVDCKSDIAISILDVVNYLTDIDTVELMFKNIYKNLNDDGVFVFDIHHQSVLRNFNNFFDFEEDGDEQFIWESSVNNHNICHYFQIVDENYKVHVEKHYQTFYNKDLIVKLLGKCGFVNITSKIEYNHHIITAHKERDE